MDKIIVICGPTATGKTRLALLLAKRFKGELVSADSRQVYKDLNIGTGKEYSGDPDIPIWGYDIVSPKDNFSVADFENYATLKISKILASNKVPILVGGTGLYIKSVVDGIQTSVVPIDEKLRSSLINKTTTELLEILEQKSPRYVNRLNDSDKHNPRRLIRAIEIVESQVVIPKSGTRYEALFLGLTAPRNVLYENIVRSVNKRLEAGIKEEIKGLLESGVDWGDQSMSSLGYRQWREFFEGSKTEEEVVREWIYEEQQYVKRQMTWFQKDKRINWFDIIMSNYVENVIELCQDFLSNAKKN